MVTTNEETPAQNWDAVRGSSFRLNRWDCDYLGHSS